MIARQPSLLDLAPGPVADAGFASLRRVPLALGAWVDLAPGWVQGHDALFESVLAAADWQVWTRRLFDADVVQPRLSVTWAQTGLPDGLAVLGDMADLLSARYGGRLTRISANLYRDGADSVAWHGDTHLRDLDTATVAVISLGHPRPFRLRPRGGGPSLGWDLGRGDLAVMGGTCQRRREVRNLSPSHGSTPQVSRGSP